MRKKAYIFPGQGAQKPYMGKSFYDHYLVAKEVYQEAEDVLNMQITRKIFNSDESFLKRTDFCQVALFVTSMAILKVMEKEGSLYQSITSGLSLGEYSALCAAKKASFKDTLMLVQNRGKFMQEAIAYPKQAMSAIAGLRPEEIEGIAQIANINCPNQVIISGSIKEIELAEQRLKQKGARRVIRLNVAGAFHSSYMEGAKKKLSPYIKDLTIQESDILFVMNVTGLTAGSSSLIKRNLNNQITSMTNWAKCVKEMERYDVDYIEVGPKQLNSINRKNGIKNQIKTIENIEDLEKIYEKI